MNANLYKQAKEQEGAEDHNVGKLRYKLKEIVDDIAEAKRSKLENLHLHYETTARLDKLETDVQTEGRRQNMFVLEIEEITKRLESQAERLRKAEVLFYDEDEAREVLEDKEAILEQEIDELESQVKTMKRTLEVNGIRILDGERRIQVCKNEIERLREKADADEKRGAEMDETIAAHGKSLDELEEREGAAGERESMNENKVHFLIGQVKEFEIRADTAERLNAVANNLLAETEAGIASWAQKTADMEDTMDNMNGLADDPSYVLSKRSKQQARRGSSLRE